MPVPYVSSEKSSARGISGTSEVKRSAKEEKQLFMRYLTYPSILIPLLLEEASSEHQALRVQYDAEKWWLPTTAAQ